jgi:hypothetical protein
MLPRTKATLDQLKAAAWFSRVGEAVDGQDIVQVPSWSEAMRQCASTDWQALLVEAANRYSEAVARKSPEAFAHWNAIADELRPLVVELVREKTAEVIKRNGLPHSFEQTIQWDTLHLLMESEYADVYSPGFFASQAFWYMEGHFPCGWKGDFPEGQLVVF